MNINNRPYVWYVHMIIYVIVQYQLSCNMCLYQRFKISGRMDQEIFEAEIHKRVNEPVKRNGRLTSSDQAESSEDIQDQELQVNDRLDD